MAVIITYPIIGSISNALSVQLDKQYFLDLFDRTYPFAYLFPMKTTPNGGYETFQATAAMAARVSLSLFRLSNDLLSIYAPVGNLAKGTVEFTRPTDAAGAVTILGGTVVSTSVGGRQFTTDANVAFGATDLGPFEVTVTAVASGYTYNVTGPSFAASGEFIPGAIDTIYALHTAPLYGDITFEVSQVTDTVGGTNQALESIANDRGITRGGTETIESFRLRVRTLPDTVSPGAVRRAVGAIMGASGFCFREVGTPLFRGVFFDGDDTTGDVKKIDFFDIDSLVFDGVHTSGSFVKDELVELRNSLGYVLARGWFGSIENADTRFFLIRQSGQPQVGAGITLVGLQSGAVFTPASFVDVSAAVNARRFRLNLDYVEFRGFFLIGLPRLNLGEFGMAFDDGPRNAFDYTTKQTNYFDGFPVVADQLYTSVFNAVKNTKAGGVGFTIYLEDIDCN
jgi:hypothetical protein